MLQAGELGFPCVVKADGLSSGKGAIIYTELNARWFKDKDPARATVDDLVMERLSGKRSVQEVLLEALKRRKKSATMRKR